MFPYCPSEENWSIDWEAIASRFDWFSALANCQQNPEYHAEGDVLTHTKMVCEALVSLPKWRELPPKERSILFAAALLHDVAKPAATEIAIDGSISSKGHVLQGAKMTQQILWDLNVPFAERQAIVCLVKYGSLPLWFWDKPNPEKSVIRISQIIRCDWLAMLAEADVRGRYCQDKEQLFDRIDFFREFCQENRCWQQPRQFPTSHSRFVYFQQEEGNPDYEAYDDTRFQVVMMSGLPGSGKDTWVKKNLPDWEVISLDELRQKMGVTPNEDQGIVANAAKAIAKDYMRSRQSFVWNATNLSTELRSMLIRQFASYQAKIQIVYLEASWEELLRRNKNRAAKVPEKVILKMRNRLEVPNITEAHQVDWIVN
jgi:putative nucleotidyltransferase with HDIG domain